MSTALSLTFFLLCLLCPSACAEGVKNGLVLAVSKALPALFPFFVASALLVRSGLAERISHILARPVAVLYRLPPSAASAVVLGLTGGYPVGAATAAELVEHGAISLEDAARINSFCNCASPGFCIGLAGLGVFGSAKTGAALYIIHICSALITGLFTARNSTIPEFNQTKAARKDTSFTTAFCGAIQQSAGTALTVTANLAIFSVLLELIRPILNALPHGMVLAGVIELTNGLEALSSFTFPVGVKLTLVSFILGFGGLSVHFQVRAIAATLDMPTHNFTCAKLLHGSISAALTAAIFRLAPKALEAFSPASADLMSNAPTWAALILICTFIIYTGNKSGNAV